MVGGIVTEVSRGNGRTHVCVAECGHYPKHSIAERPDDRPICHRPDTCRVYTDERKRADGSKVTIEVGDSLWWQGGDCMWTPKASGRVRCGVDCDIRLGKIGYSH